MAGTSCAGGFSIGVALDVAGLPGRLQGRLSLRLPRWRPPKDLLMRLSAPGLLGIQQFQNWLI
jgi:hypothetical protein